MIIMKYGNKGKLFFIFLLLSIESARNLFTAWLAAELIDLMIGGGMIFDSIWTIVLVGIIGILFFGLSKQIEATLRTNFIKELNVDIKELLLQDIFYRKKSVRSENDLSFMTNDLKLLETKGIESEFTILQYGIQFFVALTASLVINPLLGLVYLISSSFPYTLSHFTKKGIRETSVKWSEENNIYTNKLKDFLSGLLSIKTYNGQKAAINNVKNSAINMENALQKMNFLVQSTNNWTMTLIDLMTTIIPYSVAAYMVIGNQLELAEFIMVNRLAGFLVAPIVVTLNSKNKIRETEAIQKKMSLAQERIKAMKGSSQKERIPFENDLKLEKVKMNFGDKSIFDCLDFEVNKGEKVLLMAPSGFGKSTLLRILQKEVALQDGQYLIDDVSVSDESQINELIGVIPQQPYLFNDTLEFNLTLGNEFSKEDILEATDRAGLTDIVNEKGLNFIVGENGNHLSGGQKQRVEMARAFLRKRPILLADEMTANLDNALSKEIRTKLLESEETLIEAAHKVSPEEMALYDKIYQLDELNQPA